LKEEYPEAFLDNDTVEEYPDRYSRKKGSGYRIVPIVSPDDEGYEQYENIPRQEVVTYENVDIESINLRLTYTDILKHENFSTALCDIALLKINKHTYEEIGKRLRIHASTAQRNYKKFLKIMKNHKEEF